MTRKAIIMLNEKEKIKLERLFREIKNPNLSVYAANTFVTVCYIHRLGEVEPAIKLLTSLFNYLGRNGNSTLIKNVFNSLDGNELELSKCAPANVEVARIFKKNSKHNLA